MKRISQYIKMKAEEAVKASEATRDAKAEKILAKANLGQKLSSAELDYLAKKCPDAYANFD